MSTVAAVAEASQHLKPLISDLGLILMTAGIAVLLFKKIKQPLVLGYLIAGFLAGNHFDFFPSVKDVHSVEIWAEIGVIILLFSLGLEFSFKKLMKVGGTASITAITQIIAMVLIGYLVGKWMGWKDMDCIFLGVILSISSTTIILKTFDELGVKAQQFAGIVIGSLIVQDIIAILMMVLLSTVAVSQQFSGSELLLSVLKLVFFLIAWFVGGIFFIPTLLKKTKHLLTDEMMLILSLALCLMMVILASNAGFSPALGAFIMGSIIAETTQAEHIEHLVKPVKDLFGAVFFVSVGMLINPHTLYEYALPVIILTFVTIFGQSISSTVGAIISGQPLKQSVQTGMSLAQIGEFSFITPFMVKMAVPFSGYLEKKLPRKWTKRIARYSTNAQAIRSVSTWQIVIRAHLLQILLHTIIITSVILLSSKFVLPLVENSKFGNMIAALITMVVISPFLWALSLRRVAVKEVDQLFEEKKYRGPILMLFFFRMALAVFYIGFLLNIFFSPVIAFFALVLAIVVYLFFPKQLHQQYHKIESHFLTNLNDREEKKIDRRYANLTPWDGHMTTFEISKESNIAGKTLREIKMRELVGVNIAYIKRGEIIIQIPNKTERLFPGDEICVIGSDEQVKEFSNFLRQHDVEIPKKVTDEIMLRQVELTNEDFIGLSVGQSKLRERTHGLLVGIERKGQRILNPESNIILEKNDLLWIVGDKKLIAQLFKE